MLNQKKLTYVIETGVSDPKKRCEAVTYKDYRKLGVSRCRRDDTDEILLGKHRVKLCCVHRSITLQEFQEACQLYLKQADGIYNTKLRKKTFGPVVQLKRAQASEA